MSDTCPVKASGKHVFIDAGTRMIIKIWYQVYVCEGCGEERLVPMQ